MKTIRAHITGLVQGIFFRANTEKKARELGLCGWVKNESDGSVSLVVQGESDVVDQLVTWCHKGSEGARVDNVKMEEMKDSEVFSDFKIRY